MGLANNKINQVVGVDIGGTHIAAAIVVKNKPIQHSFFQAKLNSRSTAEVIIDTWVATIHKVLQSLGSENKFIAVAMPGPFDYENGISLITGMNKYESLYGLNIKNILSEQLSIDPSQIHFFNDAKCFILGEAVAGAAVNYKKVIGITIGTGLGSARCNDFFAEDVNLGSSAFSDGIVEDYLSTRWFTKRYQELTGKAVLDVKALCLIANEDDVIDLIFSEFAQNLTDFLTVFIEDELPEVVVVGGNIARAEDRFIATVRNNLYDRFPEVQIKITALWEQAAMVGACCAINKIDTLSDQLEIEI